MSDVSLTCFGGVGAVTGANFLLETKSQKILIDCGLLQGLPTADTINAEPFDYDPATINMLFVTHAHIDHIGKVPKLVKDGFRGKIYSTPATKDIAALMLADMVKINPNLYGLQDVDQALSLWHTIAYHEVQDFGDFKLELFDAGHILGSAMYTLSFPSSQTGQAGKSLMFTGDIGNSPSPLLRPTEKVTGLTYMLMDSVYGDRNHESKEERDEKFISVIQETVEQGRTLLIPVFSLERTQIMLYELNKLFESKQLKPVPVFLDSPLAIRVTEIYERVSKHYNDAVQSDISGGDDVFKFPKLRETAQIRDSREITNISGAKIILAGSGMSTAGRILGHEENFLPDPDATILFVGYQAPGTLGRLISEGSKKVIINEREVEVRAKVVNIDGYSAHADSNSLVEFVSSSAKTLQKVFVAMGEPKASIFLAQRLHNELGVDALVPERGKRYDLDI
jgi:metallo-beta-lactamase family protein